MILYWHACALNSGFDVNSKSKFGILAPSLAILAVLGGCAKEPAPLPVPTPPKVVFDTLITSQPDGLRCNVTGTHGQTQTVTTPRLVSMSELGGPVKIRCFAENFWTEQVAVSAGSRKPLLVRATEGEKITPANAAVRGPDVGPGGEFPRQVTVTLHRNAFKSATERDSYYAKQIRRLAKDWVRLMALAKSECESSVISQKGRSAVSLPTVCREGLQRLEARKRAEMQVVEQQRRRSKRAYPLDTHTPHI